MKLKTPLYLLMILSFSLFSCKKEDESPQVLLNGKWIAQSSSIQSTVIAGDGSYLQFNSSELTGNGTDFMASDTTYGTFSYSINEAGTILTMIDASADGGMWNGEWDILDLTKSTLKITGSTFLGNLTVTFSK